MHGLSNRIQPPLFLSSSSSAAVGGRGRFTDDKVRFTDDVVRFTDEVVRFTDDVVRFTACHPFYG